MKVPAYPTPPPPMETTGRNGFRLSTDFSHSVVSPPASEAPGRPYPHARNRHPCVPLPHRGPSPPPASFIREPFLNRATNGKREAESHRERRRRRRRCRPDTRPGRRGLPSPTAQACARPTSPVPRPVKGAGVGRACLPASPAPTHPTPSPRFRPCQRWKRARSFAEVTLGMSSEQKREFGIVTLWFCE